MKTTGSDSNYEGGNVLIKCPNGTFINRRVIEYENLYIIAKNIDIDNEFMNEIKVSKSIKRYTKSIPTIKYLRYKL